MLMPWMKIHFALTVMAPKVSRNGTRKATTRVKLPTSIINQRLSLDWDHIKGSIPEHICGPIWIYNLCDIKDERAWGLYNDIVFLNAVTTWHFSQFQLM